MAVLSMASPLSSGRAWRASSLLFTLGITIYAGNVCIPCFLNLSGTYHTLAYGGARFAGARICHLFKGEWGDFNLQVDTVEQRSGYAVQVLLYLSRTAYTSLGGMRVIPAWTRIHRGYQHKTCRVLYIASDA